MTSQCARIPSDARRRAMARQAERQAAETMPTAAQRFGWHCLGCSKHGRAVDRADAARQHDGLSWCEHRVTIRPLGTQGEDSR